MEVEVVSCSVYRGRVVLCVVGDCGKVVIPVEGLVLNKTSVDIVDVSGTTRGLEVSLPVVVFPVTGTEADQEDLSE